MVGQMNGAGTKESLQAVLDWNNVLGSRVWLRINTVNWIATYRTHVLMDMLVSLTDLILMSSVPPPGQSHALCFRSRVLDSGNVFKDTTYTCVVTFQNPISSCIFKELSLKLCPPWCGIVLMVLGS